MGGAKIHQDGHEIGEHDERDEAERARQPSPLLAPSPFEAATDDDPELATRAAAAGRLALRVVNRAISEAVPGCTVSIGSASVRTDQSGRAQLAISNLSEGEHEFSAVAADVAEDEPGPGFPANTGKDRVWRPLKGVIEVRGGRVSVVSPTEWLKMVGAELRILLQPLWMRSPLFSNRPHPPDMITIHHTAGQLSGDLNEFLYGGKVSVHYVVAPNGEVYKLVDDSKNAAHAGSSFWQGAENLNGSSIGIEISHQTGVEYPAEQVDAVVNLVRRLKTAFPAISAGRVIGHSDIGITIPEDRPPKKHGRKSTDPGSAFPWERIEAMGLSFQIAPGNVRPDIYGGFFQQFPNGKLRNGDNDAAHRYDGQVRPGISGAIKELQQDLEKIGYLCRPIDGDYGGITSIAVQMFQQRIFSGSRRTGPDHWNSGDGNLDAKTSELIKRVLGEVKPVQVSGQRRLRDLDAIELENLISELSAKVDQLEDKARIGAGEEGLDDDIFQRRMYLEELRLDLEALRREPVDHSMEPEAPPRAAAPPKGLAVVIGHSPEGDCGANGRSPPFPAEIKDGRAEYYWNRELADRIREKAVARGIKIDIFHRWQSGSEGIRTAYRKVAAFNPQACVELHFNSATNINATGTETLYGKPGSIPWARSLQQQMVRIYGRTGSQDRGLKDAIEHGRGVLSLTNEVQPSALIEPFFGHNHQDAELGVKLKDELATAVVESFIHFVGAPAVGTVAVASAKATGGGQWRALRDVASSVAIEFPRLKGIAFSQWALESGYGSSDLAKLHRNFAGMKWRPFMSDLAEKVWYEAHDGGEFYCKFASAEKFIAGYWARLDRHPAYRGWREHAATAEGFFRFIADIWAPPSSNPNYVGKVLAIYEQLKREEGLPSEGTPVASAAVREAASAVASDEDLWIDRTEEVIAARRAARPSDAEVASARAQAQVGWASDEVSFDYRHLESPLPVGMQFSFTANDLELLALLNDFPVAESGATPILFGLRGTAIVSGGSADDGGWRSEVVLKDIRPNHHETRCVMGVWDRAGRRIAIYPGSTVPHAEAVVDWYSTREAGNMMHTGLYRYVCGDHNGKPGCFLLRENLTLESRWKVIVRRSSNNLVYENTDMLQNMAPGNNIHPTFSQDTGWFSSLGCQVVVGYATAAGQHSGPWAKFRASAGLTDANGEPGKRYLYMLLTGREALIASQIRRNGQSGDSTETSRLRRLRFGSRGDAVGRLQQSLGIAAPDREFSPYTAELLCKRQRVITQEQCDGILTPKLDMELGIGALSTPSVATGRDAEERALTTARQVGDEAGLVTGSPRIRGAFRMGSPSEASRADTFPRARAVRSEGGGFAANLVDAAYKLVPAEAVAAYISLVATAKAIFGQSPPTLWDPNLHFVQIGIAWLLLLVTVVLRVFGTMDPKARRPWKTIQWLVVIFSAAAFVSLVYASGGTFWDHQVTELQRFAANVMTLVLGIIVPVIYAFVVARRS